MLQNAGDQEAGEHEENADAEGAQHFFLRNHMGDEDEHDSEPTESLQSSAEGSLAYHPHLHSHESISVLLAKQIRRH